MKVWVALVLVCLAAGALGWALRPEPPEVYVSGGSGQGPVEFYTHVEDVTKIKQACDQIREDWPSPQAKLVVVYVGDESVAANACRPPRADR
jgi:hypothetical protein